MFLKKGMLLKGITGGIIIAAFLPLGCSAATPGLSPHIKAVLAEGVLSLANDRIERRFIWNGGNLQSIELINKQTGHRWSLQAESPEQGNAPDITPFGKLLEARDGKLQTKEIMASATVPAHLEVVISFNADALDVKRTCRIFENIPAINCSLAYRGKPHQKSGQTKASRDVIESATHKQVFRGDIVEHLALPKGHWSFEAVKFRVATDYNDWLVNVEEGEIFRKDQRIIGNILRLEERVKGEQIFIVKEAPVGDDQIFWPGYDFVTRDKSVRVVGGGIDPQKLDPKNWQRAYSVTVGVAKPGRYEVLKALREYRESMRSYSHARDGMILLNTWGDRGRDASMGEDFVLRELQAAHKLGLSHFQLDDGWQAGLSKNSSKAEGKMWESWTKEAWQVHPERFPNGLGPVIKQAQEYNIELGLWFNPTSENEYALWRRDAQILIDLYQEHGIRIFKLDGIAVPSMRARYNFEKFLQLVYDKTDGNVVFNIDVTAGRRLGFVNPLNSYGNIFVENRYTDWGNYYPYRTLRNLWSLSAYVPPQFLQMEFLNIWRNPDKYPSGDPYAPSNVSFDYAFAVTMMAQPLAWLEASNLPEQAMEASAVIKGYRALAPKIHSGRIYPIGTRPDGASWTGFQSVVSDNTGYLLIFRENNDRPKASITTFLLENQYVCLTPELGSGAAFGAQIGQDGRIPVTLNNPHSYALYAYTLFPKKQDCPQ